MADKREDEREKKKKIKISIKTGGGGKREGEKKKKNGELLQGKAADFRNLFFFFKSLVHLRF